MDLIRNDIKHERAVAVGISPGRTSKSVKCRTSRSQFEEIPFYRDESTGITYRPSDHVYLDNSRSDQPYFICAIEGLKLTKRNNVLAMVKWIYRPSEVPESVYQMLVQDRHTEDTGNTPVLTDPLIKSREVFISDVTDTYPVSTLRGKCRVLEHQDLASVCDFKPLPDTFFSVLRYNPDTKRLANTQGEIRVGPSHQVVPPAYRPNVAPEQMPERCSSWEDLVWRPSMIVDNDLLIYLHAVRSMAAFVGMCDGGSTEDGCIAASMDETTSNALDTLHKNDYDTGMSLQALVKTINPKSIEKRWTEDDAKKFVKGLRMYGKNFFKIQSELLPNKDTSQLVEYYYFWKKTPSALTSRPHRRHRRTTTLRKQTRTPQPSLGEYLDLSSASELSDNDSDDSDSRELSGYSCRHCYTTKSRDWHHGGKDNVLLCTDCRHYYKKYGEDRPLDKSHDLPPFLFKPVRDDDSDKLSKGTRGSPEDTSDQSLPKSPSADSLCSSSSGRDYRDRRTKREDQKRHVDSSDPEDSKPLKRRKEVKEWCDSPSESFTDSSSACNEDIHPATQGRQDELTSTTSSSTPSPANDSDHKPLPTLAYSPEDVKPDLSRLVTTSGDTTVTDTSTTASAVTSVGQAVTPVADIVIKTEVKTEPVSSYDWSSRGIAVTTDGATRRSDVTSEADRGAPQGPLAVLTQRVARDELLPLQRSPPPPLKPSSPRMSPLPFMCRNSPVTTQRSSPGIQQRASPVAGQRASPVLGARSSPGIMHRGSPRPMHHGSSGQMHRGSPTPMHRGSSPGPMRHGSPGPMRHGSPGPMRHNSPVSMRHGSPGPMRHGSPGPMRHGSPGPMRHGSPGPMRHGSPGPMHRGSSPGPMRHCSPVPMHHGSPGPMRRGSPTPMRCGSPTLMRRGSPTPLHRGSPVPQRHGSPLALHHGLPLLPPQLTGQPPRTGFGPLPGSMTLPGSLYPLPAQPLSGSLYPVLPPDVALQRSLQGPSQGPPPLVSSTAARSTQLLDIHCKQEQPETPPPLVPGLPVMRSRTPPPIAPAVRPHSPTQTRPRSRSRSRSPVRDVDSPASDTVEAARSPSPPARIVDEECYRSKNAIFIKHWSRGWDSCSRCDFEFKPVARVSSGHDLQRTKQQAGTSQPKPSATIKTERKEELKEEERVAKKPHTPPENKSADAQITSNFMSTQIPSYPGRAERLTPRGAFLGPDPTPALRQLSEYARPHALGVQQDPQLAYSLGQMGPVVDPYHAMASMYPPGSRERLEIELERDKRERDAREREMREHELREMEMCEKMKREAEMKPPGLDRFPGTITEWVELQRRYSMMMPPGSQMPGGGPMHGNPHIPGVYPPASLANDLLQRERERLERLDPAMAERLSAEWLQSEQRMAMAADPMIRLQMAGLHQSAAAVAAAAAAAHTHTHAHAHTHLHLHQPDPALGVPPLHPPPPGMGPQSASAMEVAAAARGLPGPYPLPHGHPLMMAAREQELLYRDLLSRPPYSTDPILAHQLMVQAAAQQESLQRQVAIERDRLCLPPWNGQS